MTIRQITHDKKQFLNLLLLADEQESMVDRYLERGEMFALFDPEVRAVCVITDEGNGVFEIKNIATDPAFQGRGYGRALIEFALEHCRGKGRVMMVGTGDSPSPCLFTSAAALRKATASKTFSPTTMTTPSSRPGCSWWTWCI